MGRERCLAVVVAEGEPAGHLTTEQVPQLVHVGRAERRSDKAPAGSEDARQLAHAEIEIGHVVEHPVRGDTVERVVLERQLLHVGDLRVDPAGARQLDHALRDVDRDDLRAELALDALGELAHAAADVEESLRTRLAHRLEDDVFRIDALHQRAIGLVALREALLAGVLPLDDERVVELHGSMIGLPGMPRPGPFPPNQALTVAPTSANSPSWTRALRRSAPRRTQAGARAPWSGRSRRSSGRSRGRR